MSAPTSGFNAKVRLNSQVYNAAEWSVEEDAPGQEAPNTEGVAGNPSGAATNAVGTMAIVPGLKGCRVMVKNATFDPANNPFAAPLNVLPQTYISCAIYPYGLAGTPWSFNSLYVEHADQRGDVKGMEPVTINGRSDGGYSRPTS